MQPDPTPAPAAPVRALDSLAAAEARYVEHPTERNRIAADVRRMMVDMAA